MCVLLVTGFFRRVGTVRAKDIPLRVGFAYLNGGREGQAALEIGEEVMLLRITVCVGTARRLPAIVGGEFARAE